MNGVRLVRIKGIYKSKLDDKGESIEDVLPGVSKSSVSLIKGKSYQTY